MNKEIRTFIEKCPKAELHYHIDCISPDLFWKFSMRNNIETPFNSLDEVIQFYNYNSLEEFINVVLTTNSSITKEEDFSDMILECVRDMVQQNIIYREVMFDYTACYGRRGIKLETVINGFSKGLKIAKKIYKDFHLKFIANIDRTANVDDNCEYIKSLVKYKESIPLIAIGMDMQEIGYPGNLQRKAFKLAKEYGFYLTGHHGEDAGAEAIWNALDNLYLDRIDHGVRAVEDKRLLRLLANKKLLLTLCPESNIALGVYPSWDKYPIKELLNSGVKVCINSDDPPCFSYNLTGNLIKISQTFKLSKQEVVGLIRNAFKYNFEVSEYLSSVDKWINSN